MKLFFDQTVWFDVVQNIFYVFKIYYEHEVLKNPITLTRLQQIMISLGSGQSFGSALFGYRNNEALLRLLRGAIERYLVRIQSNVWGASNTINASSDFTKILLVKMEGGKWAGAKF